ncbi:hypothetical protein HanIR_Chr17g0874101 [Helianthus annuus]|nr:hypothetical protein HanIR_Chr17g0874101 [Helianthus annuus]
MNFKNRNKLWLLMYRVCTTNLFTKQLCKNTTYRPNINCSCVLGCTKKEFGCPVLPSTYVECTWLPFDLLNITDYICNG